MHAKIAAMRGMFLVLLPAVVCVGCGSKIDEKNISPPNECPGDTTVFTYPLPLPPKAVTVADFAVDDDFVYFTDAGTWQSSGYNNDGRVLKMPVEGGDIITLASGEVLPLHIVIDEKNIYWTTESAIRTMPLLGGAPATLASGMGTPQDIALDRQFVYWTTNLSRLMRATLDGSNVAEMVNESATSFAFTGLAVDSAHVYWASQGEIGTTDGSILKMPIVGGGVTTVVTGQSGPFRVALDETNVYWTNAGDFNTPVGLFKAPIAGGSPTTIVTTQSPAFAQYHAIGGLVLGAQSLFYSTRGTKEYDYYDGTVVRRSRDGDISTTLASAIHNASDSIIVRGCYVYFGAGGNVHRVRVP